MRSAVYARYSSDQQRDASIEDQVEVCRRLIESKDWTLVVTYEDRALSGGSPFRPGYQQMLADAEAGAFDVIVVEALDRLGRKLADIAALHDRLQFVDVAIHTVATGEVTAMHVGMLGTMAQLYLADISPTCAKKPAAASSAARSRAASRVVTRTATTSSRAVRVASDASTRPKPPSCGVYSRPSLSGGVRGRSRAS